MRLSSPHHHRSRRPLARLSVFILIAALTQLAHAGPREQAKRIHDRLTGVPPNEATLTSMATKIENGDALGAATEAMQHPAFYNTTIREFATPWSNRDQSPYNELNDTTATVIGMVRDDVPFDQLLHSDLVYVGGAGVSNTPYSQSDNAHYQQLQNDGIDLSDAQNLVATTQSSLPGSPLQAAQTAGVLTTRGYSEAFLVAGTNRAAVRFATLNFMCLDMEEMRDVTAWPDRIRKDVSRAPGGDSAIFLNDCLACHAGLDALAGAFAFYDFDEELQQLVYTPDAVQAKYSRDAAVFPYGFETLGDSWINYWRTGPNAHVGWNGPGSGMGAKSLGMELSQNRRFAECQVTKAITKVCHRTPNGAADLQAVASIADSFEANNRSMQRVFAESAVHCMGE
ncbi:MAG: hypothetical protein AB8B93_00140 [Pseudomonadales bacterium]